jgi:NAD(P)-dependent dehydrogenase (short-subunit alcohol dehydrogenase family)
MKGKVAIITGGESGIGAAAARQLSERGADVIVAGLNAGGVPGGIECDVADRDTPDLLVQTALDRHGRIDILVNSAGVALMARAEEIERADWQRVVNINLTGLFFVTQAVGRVMIEHGGGAIVNLASMAGLAGMPDHAAYVATKHAVVGLTKSLAIEWARFGVRVNCLCPGLTDTEIVRNATRHAPEVLEERARRNVMQRLATPDEQASMITFLVSPEASYVNGMVANVDGGNLALYSGYSAATRATSVA